jgi:hypothetical protein
MRAARKRFVRRSQPQTIRRRPVGDGTAVSRYMNNAGGRAAMKEALWAQRQAQSGLCAKCQKHMPLDNCKFEYRECPDGVQNLATHKKC